MSAPPRMEQPEAPSVDPSGLQHEREDTRVPLDSRELLRGARWIEIRHNGETYRLQATRLGKLILTK